MRHFTKQPKKWILSTLLIAALGSQYYFSVNSMQLGTAEFSSTAAEIKKQDEDVSSRIKELTSLLEKAPNKTELEQLRRYKMTNQLAHLKNEKKKISEMKPDAVPVEGKTSYTLLGCGECGENGITVIADPKDIAKIASILSAKKPESAVSTSEDKAKAVEIANETPAEKRAREKAEREEARAEVQRKKDEIAEAKAEKIRQEQLDRNDQFSEKAQEIAERCDTDLDCKVSKLTSLLSRYTGKKKVDNFAVTKVFNEFINKDLKAGLLGDNGIEGKNATLSAIEKLMQNTPADYRSLKNRIIEEAKVAQLGQASMVNSLFKQADLFTKQNKLNEALQTRDQGFQAQAIFEKDANVIYQTMYTGLQQSSYKDQLTMDYLKNNYAPDISKVLAHLTNTNGLGVDSAASSSTLNGVSNTQPSQNSRSGRIGNQTQSASNNTIQGLSNSQNNLSGVIFNAPSSNRVINRTGLAK